MIIKNGFVLDSEKIEFIKKDILIENNIICEVGDNIDADCEKIDVTGKYVIPSFIDIHTHGGMGFDFLDASVSEIEKLLDYYESKNTKTIYATTVTAPKEKILTAIKNIREAAEMYKNVTIEGIHIEGPFISDKQPGCHKISEIRYPSISELDEICHAANGMKLRITLAPEVHGAEEFIKEAVKRGIKIGIGHSNADAETVKKALNWGADTMIHLYNAMTPLHHRKPGCVGAGLLSDAYTELIVDGMHINPDIVNLTYKIKGKDKLVLITDSMQAAGMPDGKYELGGVEVYMREQKVTTADGTLAGSTLNLPNAVKNLMKFAKVGFAEAVICATKNPAKAVGIYDKVGSIEKGKRADISILSEI